MDQNLHCYNNFDLVIIGGGFSGLLLSYHCKTLVPKLSIVVVNKDSEIGGMAYHHAPENVVLNVPHSKMSAFSASPDDFANFITKNNLPLLDQAFARRNDYQKYLLSIKEKAITLGVNFISEEALTAQKISGKWKVNTNKTSFYTNQLVLALGNFPPKKLLENEKVNLVVENPWTENIIDSLLEEKQIAIIGTGLTAIDLVWELYNKNYQGRILLSSRRGLIPMGHDLSIKPHNWNGPKHSALSMLKYFQEQKKSHNWRAVIDGLRPITTEVWLNWNLKEQKRFLRHLRPYWDVARHRLAPTLSGKIEEMLKSKMVEIIKGRISEFEFLPKENQIQINFKNRQPISVDRIVNCTGSANINSTSSFLLSNLISNNQIRVDQLKIGLLTDQEGRLDSPNSTFSNIYALGPLRKGMLWENVAIPELKLEAEKLAQTILADQKR